MAMLFEKEIPKNELMKYIGDISQVADAREAILSSGKADGVRIIDVKTGSGLNFTILPSRGLDIAWAEYRGKSLAFISKTGVVSPAYFEKDGLEFLRSFTCGMLTTCGLTYMGAPCVDQAQPLGLHGRISNTPAEDVSVYKEWEGDEFVIKVRGKVRESAMFGENICLTREITTKMGSNKFQVKDVIENCGFNAQPFMLLYHYNFGYPVVSEDTVLYETPAKVEARDTEAQSGIDAYNKCQKPTHDFREHVFFHDLECIGNGDAYCCLFNKKIKFGAYIKLNRKECSHFGEWKMMGEGDYVVGLEPCTWLPLGRAEARKRGELEYIKPGEVKIFTFEIGVVESEQEIKDLG